MKRPAYMRSDERLLWRDIWDVKNKNETVSHRAWVRTCKAERLSAPKMWGWEEVSLTESQRESDLERYDPAISTIDAIDNGAEISFKCLRFIENQTMFLE